ncbi:hypothetical protein AR457_14845 [Streptomyces agglomeratus]|uniref:Uncharacterized protein n=1 Tax=Streptomyces agglomeratus TaxID=285458 RepID=A0A1E5P7R1_9ACTN|nr:hypothetical protein [Streptomyces agglomeratus]OEJ25555.1 hypothetical protein AS594_14660 [Streptomyces agglomeratus]OEJ40407.1 hypothetical protein BGK70_21810 [Streptomyces agglomeratus]OEJ45215.1 hypothetical protein AR457_14845 [Streptomyces agglomeratus]OEJ52958.1 hypothetical protein BGK72_21450 [Streptomyces agglomeratus]OEJ60294.1 hypothetical protein BGM19_22155 [Streptomyces agglomeratus]
MVQPPWIDPKESLHYKEVYRDIAHSVALLKLDVTALSSSFTGLKFDITAIALGLTLVKADFTLIKMDEKGITLAGKQKVTFPWADQKKRLEERIDNERDRNAKRSQEIRNELKRIEKLKEGITEKKAEANAAHKSGEKAELFRIRSEIGKLTTDIDKAEATVRKKVREIGRISGVQAKLDKLERDKKQAKISQEEIVKAARLSRDSLAGLSKEMRSTRREMANLGSTVG